MVHHLVRSSRFWSGVVFLSVAGVLTVMINRSPEPHVAVGQGPPLSGGGPPSLGGGGWIKCRAGQQRS